MRGRRNRKRNDSDEAEGVKAVARSGKKFSGNDARDKESRRDDVVLYMIIIGMGSSRFFSFLFIHLIIPVYTLYNGNNVSLISWISGTASIIFSAEASASSLGSIL